MKPAGGFTVLVEVPVTVDVAVTVVVAVWAGGVMVLIGWTVDTEITTSGMLIVFVEDGTGVMDLVPSLVAQNSEGSPALTLCPMARRKIEAAYVRCMVNGA